MMTVSVINCQRCGGAWWSDADLGMVKTSGELCPVCRSMETATEPLPAPPAWGIAPPPTESAHDALEDLFDEVWRDEANWSLDDRIDLALGIRRDEQKKGKS